MPRKGRRDCRKSQSKNNPMNLRVEALQKEIRKTKKTGTTSAALGMNMEVDYDAGYILLHLDRYLRDKCAEFHVKGKPLGTPVPERSRLTSEMAPATPAEQAVADKTPYLQAVGSLIWAAAAVRVDVTHPVHQAARFMHNHGAAHWKSVRHVLRHLNASTARPLVLGGPSELILRIYADSNHVTSGYVEDPQQAARNLILASEADEFNDPTVERDARDCRPTTGYVAFLGDSCISWSSRTQHAISHSPTESEIKAVDEAVREAVRLRQLLTEISPKLTQKAPTTIFCDSTGAIANSKNPCFKKKLKHMPQKFHYARECSADKAVKLVKVATKDNRADFLTKNLAAADHNRRLLSAGFRPSHVESDT